MKVIDKVANLIKEKSVYLLFLVPIAAICGCGKSRGGNSDDVVYVCTGPSAECYHLDPECSGLQRCSSITESMTLNDAESEGYRHCRICSE